MLPTLDPAVLEHPRATWIDPSSGRQLDERSLMHEMATRQVVLLGETHTIAEIHRWQLHVATVLRFIRPGIAVGFEMFPRRVQPVLDEWVAGELSSQAFLEKADWAVIVSFAKGHRDEASEPGIGLLGRGTNLNDWGCYRGVAAR